MMGDTQIGVEKLTLGHDGHESMRYVYAPLPSKDHIRVLEVRPSIGSEEPIRCELRPIVLGSSNSYTALSYSWADEDGDASPCRSLLVGGKSMPITQNLFNALKRLRGTDEISTVWADAVCINQANDEEKTIQVANMANIYRNAGHTFVWLGEPTTLGIDAICSTFLRCAEHELDSKSGQPTLAVVLDRLELELGPSDTTTLEDVTRRMMIESTDTGSYNRFWMNWLEATHDRTWHELLEHPRRIAVAETVCKALQRLLGSRYFARMWVVQEIICSNTETTSFGFGALREPMRTLYTLSSGDFRQRLFDFQQLCLITPESDLDIDGAAHRIGEILRMPRDSLTDAMQSCSSRQCFDPRDRVYALLSLDPTWDLQPDYVRSTAETYTSFASSCVTRYQKLEVLSTNWRTIRSDLSELDRPSWVPDLRNGFVMPYAEKLEKSLWCWISEGDVLNFYPWYIAEVVTVQAGQQGFGQSRKLRGSYVKFRNDKYDDLHYFLDNVPPVGATREIEPGDMLYAYEEVYYDDWEISRRFVKGETNKRYEGIVLRPDSQVPSHFRLLFAFNSFWYPQDQETCSRLPLGGQDCQAVVRIL